MFVGKLFLILSLITITACTKKELCEFDQGREVFIFGHHTKVCK